MDSWVAKLLATPVKRASASTPQRKRRTLDAQVSREKSPPSKARRVGDDPVTETKSTVLPTETKSTVASLLASVKAGAVEASRQAALARQAAFEREAAMLEKLFDGVESVLVTVAARKGRPIISVIKEHVESYTLRDLTTERLEIVLALAGDMLDVTWVGSNLEVFQRVEDGETRPPTNAERIKRQDVFAENLAAAREKGSLPRRQLPERSEPSQRLGAVYSAALKEIRNAVDVKAAEKESVANALIPDAADRMKALQIRMRAKFESEKLQASYRAKAADIQRNIATCEDAVAVHTLLGSLFARAEGQDSAASDAEVLKTVCASGFSMQTQRPLDLEAATAALDCVRRNAAGWFEAVPMKYSLKPGFILRRTSSDPAATLDAIRGEQQQSKAELARINAFFQQGGSQDVTPLEATVPAAAPVAPPTQLPVASKAQDETDVEEIPLAKLAKRQRATLQEAQIRTPKKASPPKTAPAPKAKSTPKKGPAPKTSKKESAAAKRR